MRTHHLILSMSLALAAGCARTAADRAAAEPLDDDGLGRTTVAAGQGDETRTGDAQGGQTGQTGQAGQTGQTGQAGQTGATAYSDYPLVITGVFVEPTLASQCGLTMSPKAFFEFDSTNLDQRDAAVLKHIAQCLSTGPLAGRRVELVGRADPSGPDEYNRQLGRSRAEAVQQFMVDQGMQATNITVRSAGERMADPTDPSGWPLDRRVDIVLVPSP